MATRNPKANHLLDVFEKPVNNGRFQLSIPQKVSWSRIPEPSTPGVGIFRNPNYKSRVVISTDLQGQNVTFYYYKMYVYLCVHILYMYLWYLCIYAFTAMTMILSICKHALSSVILCIIWRIYINIQYVTYLQLFTVHEYIHKHGQDRSIFAEHREAQARFRSVIHLSPVMCCHVQTCRRMICFNTSIVKSYNWKLVV